MRQHRCTGHGRVQRARRVSEFGSGRLGREDLAHRAVQRFRHDRAAALHAALPASGTVRDPAAACAKLLKGTSLFAALPARTMCPMILADAGHVVVSGTYLGQKVHETVVDGGCDLARWSKLGQIFN